MKTGLLHKALLLTIAGVSFFSSCTAEFDPSYLEKQIADLQSRVDIIETGLKDMNKSLSALESVIRAVEANVYAVSVTPTEDGFAVRFSDGTSTSINIAASIPSAPIISVVEVDGVFYWTIDGEFLLDPQGNKLRVTGESAKAPVIGVKEFNGVLYWTVDGEFLLDSHGNKILVTAGNVPAPVIGVKDFGGTLYWTVNGEYVLDDNGNKVPVSGQSGAPVIGVLQDGGVLYWTVDGEYLRDANGDRVPASAQNGKDGLSPVLGVKEYDGVLYWTVNGEFILDENGHKVPAVGRSAAVPVFGVKEYNGKLYWTIDGEFVLDSNGDMVPAAGNDGTPGEPGADGHTPVFGVAEDGGRLYWTVDGEFVLDSKGNKVPVSGEAPALPVLGVKNIDGVLYWTLDGDLLLDEDGNKVVASYPGQQGGSDSVFKDARIENGGLVVILQDGTEFCIPMGASVDMTVEANKLYFSAAETKYVHVELGENIKGITITEKPDGWKAQVSGCTVSIKAPNAVTENTDTEGFVSILATSGDKTVIKRVSVTLDKPVFSMVVNPNGKMTLTELDSDLTYSGFLAGFMKADEFSPEKILEPVKNGSTAAYKTWDTMEEGLSYKMDISDSMAPVVGEKYVAYCYPGILSRYSSEGPKASDVYVKYFTYVEQTFQVSGVEVMKATLRVSFKGASQFYGGFTRIIGDVDPASYASAFLRDASAPLSNGSGGQYGVMMSTFRGNLSKFAAFDDGDGKNKSDRMVIPGARYVIGLIPKDDNRVSSEYTEDDVIIEVVELLPPVESSTSLVTVKPGPVSVTSTSVSFDLSNSVEKFFYTLVSKKNLAASGMSEYEFVSDPSTHPADVASWDRTVSKWEGPVSDMGKSCTGLRPGEECVALGLAFTLEGEYQLVKLDIASSLVLPSEGTVSVKSVEKEQMSANSMHYTIDIEHSDNIKEVRYIQKLTKEDFKYIYDEDESNVFNTLTAGSVSSYLVTEDFSIDMYIYPEDQDYILFFLGVDDEGKFTELVRYEYNPVK